MSCPTIGDVATIERQRGYSSTPREKTSDARRSGPTLTAGHRTSITLRGRSRPCCSTRTRTETRSANGGESLSTLEMLKRPHRPQHTDRHQPPTTAPAGTLRAVIAARQPGDTIAFAQAQRPDDHADQGQLRVTRTWTSRARRQPADHQRQFRQPGLRRQRRGDGDPRRPDHRQRGDRRRPRRGGGILNEAGATLTLIDASLTGNTATAASDTVDVFGGGLLNEGKPPSSPPPSAATRPWAAAAAPSSAAASAAAIDNFGGATLT